MSSKSSVCLRYLTVECPDTSLPRRRGRERGGGKRSQLTIMGTRWLACSIRFSTSFEKSSFSQIFAVVKEHEDILKQQRVRAVQRYKGWEIVTRPKNLKKTHLFSQYNIGQGHQNPFTPIFKPLTLVRHLLSHLRWVSTKVTPCMGLQAMNRSLTSSSRRITATQAAGTRTDFSMGKGLWSSTTEVTWRYYIYMWGKGNLFNSRLVIQVHFQTICASSIKTLSN